MWVAMAVVVVLFAGGALDEAEAPRASGILDGKRIEFPEEGIADGVSAAVGLLESCRDESLYKADELKKARQNDYVRLEFAKPVTVTVMEKKIRMEEMVFRRPLNTGVFWVREGDKWRRYAKYEFPKEAPFAAWLREARPAD